MSDIGKPKNKWLSFTGLCLVVLGVLAGMILLLSGLLEDVPAYNDLRTVTGTIQSCSSGSSDTGGYILRVAAGGITLDYTVNNFIDFSKERMSRAMQKSDSVTVRFEDDEYRSVMEVRCGGETVLSYADALRDYRTNQRWEAGLGAAMLALTAGCALAERARLRKRRRAAEDALERARQKAAAEAADCRPALYSDAERKVVERYITDAFGPISRVFHELPMRDIQVDIAVIEPTEREPFYRLVTMGMGARRMRVPREMAEHNRAFAELVIFLPKNWKILGSDEADTWPFFWLKKIARRPFEEDDWVTQGSLIPTGRPLDAAGNFRGILLAMAAARENCSGRLLLPDGRVVNFYQLYPVRREEMEYVDHRGTWPLWQRMMRAEILPVVDLNRESCCNPDTWFAEDIAPFELKEQDSGFLLSLTPGAFGKEAFQAAGRAGDGCDWETAARAYVKRQNPAALEKLRFESRPDCFRVRADDPGELAGFALAFRAFCEDNDGLRGLLQNPPPNT
jgi:hypothetical protein